MRRLSREPISALRLSFEAWPDVAARLAVCIALGWRWNCLTVRTPTPRLLNALLDAFVPILLANDAPMTGIATAF